MDQDLHLGVSAGPSQLDVPSPPPLAVFITSCTSLCSIQYDQALHQVPVLPASTLLQHRRHGPGGVLLKAHTVMPLCSHRELN